MKNYVIQIISGFIMDGVLIMRDEYKTKEQLINELVELRQQNAQLKITETSLRQVKKPLQENEERYHAIFNNSIDAIFLTKPNGDVYAANLEACRVFGWTEEELCKIGRNGVVDANDSRLQAAMDERTRTGKFQGELTFVRKDGTKFPGEVSSAVFKDKDGLYKTSMIIRDITERKLMENELNNTNKVLKLFVQKTSRKKYLDAVLELIQDWTSCNYMGIRVLTEDGYIPYESYIGFSKEFWESENWLSVMDAQCACIRVILEKPEPQDAICMTGVGSFCCNNTIKFVSEMSAEEQSRFRGKCVELGFASVAIIPLRYRNKVLGAIHIADEREGMLHKVEFIEKISPLIGEAMYRFNLEDELKQKNNELEKIVSQRTAELQIAFAHLRQEISGRELVEEALRLSEEQFYKAFKFNPAPMVVVSLYDGRFIDVNDAMLNYLGYERNDVIGKTIKKLNVFVNVDNYKYILMCGVNNNTICNMEIYFRTKSGELQIGLLSTEIIDVAGERCLLGVIQDITERKNIEREMARLAKLNLIGEMAAGIAHEIRNPMTTVRGFLQILGQKERYHQDKEHFNLMFEELDRANSIITEFLSLANNRIVDFKMRNLNNILDSLFPLIQADAMLSDKYVILELNKIPDLLLDKKEIRQLVLNLSRNGLEAIFSGEYITISTYCESDEVVLSVQDCGKGIPSDILDKIGTPFFTTKEYGTGLGLAICYSIANRHNARIQIDTGPEGTTFYVRFKVST